MSCFSKDDGEPETVIKSRISTDRKRRDVIFYIIFILFCCGLIALTGVAYAKGDPTVLMLGTDYRGNLCGLDNIGYEMSNDFVDVSLGGSVNNTLNLEDMPMRYFVNPNEMLMSFIDVDNLSNFDDFVNDDDSDDQVLGFRLKDAKSICLPSCPTNVFTDDALQWVCNYPDGYGAFEKVGGRYYGDPSDTMACSGTDSDACNGSALLASWEDNNFSYFDELVLMKDSDPLAMEAIKSSLRLEGPCYPVILPTVDVYSTCQPFEFNLSEEEEDDSEANEKSAASVAAFQALREEYEIDDAKSHLSIEEFAYIEEAINKLMTSGTARFQRYINDVKASWDVILVGGLVIPLLLGSLWLLIMRYFSGVFAWGVVLMSNVAMIAFTIVLYLKAGIITGAQITSLVNDSGADDDFNFDDHADIDPSSGDRDNIAIAAYVFTALSVILLIATIFMAKRIKIAVASLQEASIAVEKTPTVIFFPMLMSLVILGIGMWWIWTAVYLYSSGDLHRRELKTECTPSVYNATPLCHDVAAGECVDACGFEINFNTQLRYAMLYHLFGLLWTTQFVVGFTLATIAGVIAHYYWARDEPQKSPVLAAVKRTSKFHMGSIAIGSFFVATFQFIRILLKIIEEQGKKAGSSENKVIKFLLKILQCILAFVQKVIEIINRSSYIMIAINGEGYCTSAKKGVQLMANNFLIFAAVNTIGDAILFLGKLLIVLVSGLISFAYLDQEKYHLKETQVSSPFLPVAIVLMLSYLIAAIFMGVVEMAVDTLVLSFCLDLEENNGAIRCAPPKLIQLVDRVKDDDKKQKEIALANVTKNPIGNAPPDSV